MFDLDLFITSPVLSLPPHGPIHTSFHTRGLLAASSDLLKELVKMLSLVLQKVNLLLPLLVLQRPPFGLPLLDDLDGEVRELTDLVNELVSVASGELAEQPADIIDLGVLAKSVGARVARRKGRVVEVDVAAAGVVFAPPAGLERAITNLIQNAAKFDTSSGSIEVVVRGGDLRVLDRGPGIPQEDRLLIFDRFHRSVSARTMPGSGLGLAIVREIVERSGGTVSALHRDGGGADVGFSLPEA